MNKPLVYGIAIVSVVGAIAYIYTIKRAADTANTVIEKPLDTLIAGVSTIYNDVKSGYITVYGDAKSAVGLY